MSDFWKNKNVFITGTTGFLGSWLTKFLIDDKANVIALNRDITPKSILWSSSEEFDYIKEKLTVVHGCLEDYQLLERILNEYEIDTVFHLGAQTIVGVANRNPLSTFETNIRGTYHLLEACRRNKDYIQAIVVASTDKAYKANEKLPYEENAPLMGTHPYEVSKSCADLLSYAYYDTYRLPICVVRCGNLFGPGDLNFNRLIPGTIRSVIIGERPLIRSNGSIIRDYFYVKEGAFAYKYLAEKMYELNISGEVFNFSNNLQLSVLEVVDKLLEIMECSIKPQVLGEASNEVKCFYLSARKAIEILKWNPQYTHDESLKETVDWYRNFLIN